MDILWKKILRKEASAHHMCAENRQALEEVVDRADAIALYKKTIDWALEENYPSLEVLRRHFGDCEALGVFVDKVFHGEVLNDSEVYVFHNCSGEIRTGLNVERKIIPMMYFANGCNMDIRAIDEQSPKIRVPLYIFGKNRIGAEQSDSLDCVTYKFSI